MGQWWPLPVLAVAALLLAFAFPNPTPQYDEFYHLLAARSLLHEGDLTINEGARPYTRAWLFTYAVAGSQHLLGETHAAARLPSAVSHAALVTLLFWWVRRRVSAIAAALAALLLLVSLHPLHYAATVRFYSPHALAVFLTGVAAFEVVAALREHGVRAIRRWLPWSMLALASFGLAVHLQATTLIAGVALALWVGGCAVRWWARQPTLVRLRWAIGVFCAIVVFEVVMRGVGGWAFVARHYHTPRDWAAQDAGDWAFYHRQFAAWYGWAWYGLPLLALLAWRKQKTVTAFALVMAAVPLALHSALSPKADRYVLHVLPFLFVLVGMGVAGVVEGGRSFLKGSRERATLSPGWRRWGGGLAALAVGVALLYAGYRTPGLTRSVQLIAGAEVNNPFARSDWSSAAASLSPLLREADATVTSAGLKSLYYLGRLDVTVSRQGVRLAKRDSRLPTLRAEPIADPTSVRALRGRHETGVVLIEDEHWRHPAFVTDAVADCLEAEFRPVPVDPAWRLRVFQWGLDARPAMTDKPEGPVGPTPQVSHALPNG